MVPGERPVPATPGEGKQALGFFHLLIRCKCGRGYNSRIILGHGLDRANAKGGKLFLE
jgi:hypothetical protein